MTKFIDFTKAIAANEQAKPERSIRSPLLIAHGWTVADLKSRQDCDRAEAVLSQALDEIEDQLRAAQARASETGNYPDPEWQRRAQSALRLKRSAIEQVNRIRDKLKPESKSQLLLEIIKASEPQAFRRAMETAKQRYPNLSW